MKNPFLKAEWRKLIMVNYEIEPEILEKYLPYGTQLDSWNGKHYISVVGFQFLNTEVKGIRIPFHINFEQANLRFYVKRRINDEVKHGVVFIKEIVQKPLVTAVARGVFNENYCNMPMKHDVIKSNGSIEVNYGWKNNGKWSTIAVEADSKGQSTIPNSVDHFIVEHYWGYIQIDNKSSYEF